MSWNVFFAKTEKREKIQKENTLYCVTLSKKIVVRYCSRGLITFLQNCRQSIKIVVQNYIIFQFCACAEGVEQKIKISKFQLHYPTNHSPTIFYVIVFSVHSLCLNIECWQFFKIILKVQVPWFIAYARDSTFFFSFFFCFFN